jgi:energy-coupling factor transporter transmembrane protein EcfT
MAYRYWFGSILVLLGAALLADQLYPALELGDWIARLWPLVIILLGVLLLLTQTSTWIGGIMILLLGILLQIATLDIIGDRAWSLVGPGLLILLGVLVVFRLGRPGVSGGSAQDVINPFVIFSGYEIHPKIANFRGGSATAVFGGINVNLRESILAKEGALLELTAAFGGVDLVIPPDWRVDLDGLPFFGGWSNKTVPPSATEGPVLKVRCLALFGGIGIKN